MATTDDPWAQFPEVEASSSGSEWDQFPAVDAAEPQDTSFGGAFKRGAANFLKSTGATATVLGSDTVGPSMMKAGQDWTDPNYKPADVQWNSPSTWLQAPRALAEGSGQIGAAAVGAGIGSAAGPIGTVGGGVLATYATRLGDVAFERAKNNGRSEPNNDDLVEAAIGVLPEAMLNSIAVGKVPGLGKLGEGIAAKLGKGIASKAVGVAESGVKAGAVGTAADVAGQLAETTGTENGTSVDVNRALNSGVVSGATGAGARGARAVRDTVSEGVTAVKNRDVHPEEGTAAVEALKATGADLSSPKKALEALNQARDVTADNLSATRKNLDRLGANTDVVLDPDGSPSTELSLKSAIKLAKKGEIISPEHMDALQGTFGDSVEGQSTINSLRAMQGLNKLRRQMDARGRGGSNSVIGPGNIARRLADRQMTGFASAAPGVAGLGAVGAGMATAAQAATGAVAVPAAALSALAVGTRTLDKFTGRKNPTAEFVNKFEDGQRQEPSVRRSLATERNQSLVEEQKAKDAADLDKGLAGVDRSAQADTAKALKELARVEKAKRQFYERGDPNAEKAPKVSQAARNEMSARNTPEELPDYLKKAQEDAMWAAQEQEGRMPKTSVNEDLDAQAAIKQEYSARDASLKEMAKALQARAQQAQAAQSQTGIPSMQMRMMAQAVKGIQKGSPKGQTSSVPEAIKEMPKTTRKSSNTTERGEDIKDERSPDRIGDSEVITSKAKNRHAYKAAARANQRVIRDAVDKAAEVKGVSKSESAKLKEATETIASARSKAGMMAAAKVATGHIKDTKARAKALKFLKDATDVHSK